MNGIKYLEDFIKSSKPKTRDLVRFAMESFYEGFMDYYELYDFQEVLDLVDPFLLNALLSVCMEYSVSTEFELGGQTANIIDAFLKKDGKLLNKEEKDFILKLRDSYLSVYKTISVKAGCSVTFKDMLHDEEEIVINDISLSKQLKKNSKVAARLLKMNDGRVLVAAGILSLETDLAREIVKDIKELQKLQAKYWQENPHEIPEHNLKLDTRKALAKEIAFHWLAYWHERSPQNVMKSSCNFDGDPIQLCQVHFPIKSSIQELRKALDAMRILQKVADDRWNWTNTTKDRGDVLFTSLSINGFRLIADVNSKERAEIVKTRFQVALGDLIGPGLISFENMDQLLQKASTEPRPQNSLPLAVQQEAVHKYKDGYYRKWLDMNTPALGDMTPREASRSKQGRKKLIDLLEDFKLKEEAGERVSGVKAYDFGWVWAELGLTVVV